LIIINLHNNGQRGRCLEVWLRCLPQSQFIPDYLEECHVRSGERKCVVPAIIIRNDNGGDRHTSRDVLCNG